MKCIALVPQVHGVGGMVSFRHKLTAGLAKRGVQVTHDPDDPAVEAVLVIGGTRDFAALWRARRRGLPVIQRLDGMNWLHRRRRTGLRHFLRAEVANFVLTFIRARLADRIVYQSAFSHQWWEHVHGPTHVPWSVVHNGVDLQVYSPSGPHQRPTDRYRVLLVEGSLGGGYEMGLETAVELVARLNRMGLDRPVELMVVGRVSEAVRRAWDARAEVPLRWGGLVPRERIPEIDRSAHLLYSADLNAACPNAVIEALACGLPVVAFDTGALPELVPPQAGRVVPYGGDPWQLDPPDVDALAQAAAEVLRENPAFRHAARTHAETHFGLDKMVEGYLRALHQASQ